MSLPLYFKQLRSVGWLCEGIFIIRVKCKDTAVWHNFVNKTNYFVYIVATCFGLKHAVIRLVQNMQMVIKIYYSGLNTVLKSQYFHFQFIVQHRRVGPTLLKIIPSI
jgi:hypothetical protein